MEWAPQQDGALRAVAAWLANRNAPQTFYLAGYAGTGKTTLAKEIASEVHGQVCYGAFTGKAALVLQRKGCVGASTIHSLIYKPKRRKGDTVEWVLAPDSAVKTARLVIIDEVSMIDEALGTDLLSFGTRVLVLGDPAQLPPIRGEGYFTRGKPDVMLTEVHRQARDNPIIRMSMDVRQGRELKYGRYGSSKVISRREVDGAEVLAAEQILIGLNRTRRLYNQRMRERRGYGGVRPNVGERLVCLRNKHSKGLLNGGLWTAADVYNDDGNRFDMIVEPADAGASKQSVEVTCHDFFFQGRERELQFSELRGIDQFDFGYALTVHKSQGSQWDDVYLFDESESFREASNRWLYTAVTRAAEKITVVR